MDGEGEEDPTEFSASGGVDPDAFAQLQAALGATQPHLFEVEDERLSQQLVRLDATTPGGLAGYCERARVLLQQQQSATATAASSKLLPPLLGERLRANTPPFEESEELGCSQLGGCAFVLVAGGLGERLGFDGVKAALPLDTLTGKSFLEYQCEWIFALQQRARMQRSDESIVLPLAVMTSEDTHEEVVDLLSRPRAGGGNEDLGVENEEGMLLGGLTDVTVLKQEKVACFANLRGEIALNPLDRFEIVTKPHGHGDVHSLLHKTGLAQRWLERGVQWIVLFQDTNALAFRAVPAALGSSLRNDMDVNMVAVQRRKGEAIGAVVAQKMADGVRTVNVEYNLLNETSLAAKEPSPFPGNINLLVLKAAPYVAALERTRGIVPEFVNPKFADASKTEFKTPARLECMMQDVPLLFPTTARVGFTELERFLCFSPAKNNLQDALVRFQETGYAESASSCEHDFYSTGRRLLAMAGVQIRTTGLGFRRFANLPLEDGAKVVLGPGFGVTVAEIRSRFPSPQSVHISERSSLVLDGDVFIHQLDLDGMLVIKAAPGTRVFIKSLRVRNDGCEMVELGSSVAAPPSDSVRGYRKYERESLCIYASDPGDVIIDREAMMN